MSGSGVVGTFISRTFSSSRAEAPPPPQGPPLSVSLCESVSSGESYSICPFAPGSRHSASRPRGPRVWWQVPAQLRPTLSHGVDVPHRVSPSPIRGHVGRSRLSVAVNPVCERGRGSISSRPCLRLLGGWTRKRDGWLPWRFHIFCSVPFELEAATLVWPAAVTSRSHEHMPGSQLLPHLTSTCFLYCQPRGGEGGASRPEVRPPRISNTHNNTPPVLSVPCFKCLHPMTPATARRRNVASPQQAPSGPPPPPAPGTVHLLPVIRWFSFSRLFCKWNHAMWNHLHLAPFTPRRVLELVVVLFPLPSRGPAGRAALPVGSPWCRAPPPPGGSHMGPGAGNTWYRALRTAPGGGADFVSISQRRCRGGTHLSRSRTPLIPGGAALHAVFHWMLAAMPPQVSQDAWPCGKWETVPPVSGLPWCRPSTAPARRASAHSVAGGRGGVLGGEWSPSEVVPHPPPTAATDLGQVTHLSVPHLQSQHNGGHLWWKQGARRWAEAKPSTGLGFSAPHVEQAGHGRGPLASPSASSCSHRGTYLLSQNGLRVGRASFANPTQPL